MKRLLIATGTVGALCAGLIAGPAVGQGGETIYAPKNCTTPKVEPKKITLACADNGARLKSLGWDTWNTSKVKGRGRLVLDKCEPNCAEGGVARYDVKVTLLNAKLASCGGGMLQMYQRAHLRFPDKKPPNAKNLRSWKLACISTPSG